MIIEPYMNEDDDRRDEGGDGVDTASFEDEQAGVGARLDGGTNWGAAAGDIFHSIEHLVGSAFDDTLVDLIPHARVDVGRKPSLQFLLRFRKALVET